MATKIIIKAEKMVTIIYKIRIEERKDYKDYQKGCRDFPKTTKISPTHIINVFPNRHTLYV